MGWLNAYVIFEVVSVCARSLAGQQQRHRARDKSSQRIAAYKKEKREKKKEKGDTEPRNTRDKVFPFSRVSKLEAVKSYAGYMQTMW